jgi:hypothetical protein
VERDEEHVFPAIPEGSAPIQTPQRWISDILNHEKFIWRRNDFRRNVLNIAELLLERCDFASYTCTPGRDWLDGLSGLSRATVTRCLRWLRDHGFLGLVANGRMAENTPRSSDAHARWGNGYDAVADRAVYVMCQPLTDEERAERVQENIARADNRGKLARVFSRFSMAVDINEPPNRNARKSAPKGIREWASPTLKSYFEAAARVTAKIEAARTDLSWPRHRTTSANDEAEARFNELQAARTVRLHTPAVSGLSDRHLTAILRPWFRAEWSPADILEALDYRPDGAPRRNDGAHGVRNVAAWLQSRLSDHRVNGMIPYSPTKRRELAARPGRERALAYSAAHKTAGTHA